MKRVLLGMLIFTAIVAAPFTSGAEVNVRIALPPPIVFGAPPVLIVLPETYVYVVPDISEDIFFYNGWWWRPWGGQWYRSRHYNDGWAFYQRVPAFYRGVPSGWRNDYRNHQWRGHQWNYHRLPQQHVQQHWKGWAKDKHWEKQQTWGVQGLKTKKAAKPQAPSGANPQRQVGKPHAQEAVKPLHQEGKQKSPATVRSHQQVIQPQHQEQRTQTHEAVKPNHQEPTSPSREKQPQQAPQQQGSHERGGGERQDHR